MLFENRQECIEQILKNYKKWHPFPKYDERVAWESLPDSVKNEYIEEAELYHGKSMEWTIIPATLWMTPAREGNRSVYIKSINDRRRRLIVLTIAECLTANGRYIDDIFDAAVLIAEEGAWSFPPHDVKKEEPFYDALKPRVDLQAGETANALSMTLYLLGNKLEEISSFIVPQIKAAIHKHMIEPMINIQYDYFWIGKKAWSNWSPWVCENLMQAMFMCQYDDTEIVKIMDVVFETLEKYYSIIDEDCGNLEGSTYWANSAGRLFNCLEILYEVTGGEMDVFQDEKIKKMPKNVFDLQLVEDYVFNYGDASAKNNNYCSLLYRYAKRIGDESMKNFALSQIKNYGFEAGRWVDFREVMHGVFDYDEIRKSKIGPYEKKDAWYDISKYLIARSNGESRFILAAKGGRLGVNHSHHDVGNFLLFKDNNPLFIDVGGEAYCQKTFSDERWTIWCMQSSWHNLPEVNGFREELGGEDAVINKIEMTEDAVEFETELSKTFVPQAEMKEYIRNIKLDKKGDKFYLSEKITFENGNDNNVVFHLLSATKPVLSGEKLTFGNFAEMEIKADKDYKLYIEDVELKDEGLNKMWNGYVYRICIEFNGVDAVKLNVSVR